MKEEVKAGVIIVTSFLILSLSVILVGGSSLFEKIDRYYVKVSNAAGLEPGAQVRLGGVRVGRIMTIKEPVEPGKPVVMEIGLKKGTPLYKGTKALITQVGFVGDMYLLLTVEKTENERIQVGSVIPTDDAVDFTKMMAKLNGLSDSVDGLIKDVDKLFSEKNVKQVEELLTNTNRAIVSGSANIEKVAAALRATADRLMVVLGEIDDVVKTNKGEVAQLVKKAREDLDKAGEMIKSIESTSAKVGGAVDLQSRNLDALLNTLIRTTEEMEEVLHELKSKPWSIVYKEGRSE